jgi:transcriptional regulator with XRE-family HTH domain
MPYDFKKLKAAREARGINQAQLAAKMRLTRAALSLIEAGDRQSPPTIKAYAKAVGIPLRDLVISDEEFEELRNNELARR